MQASTRGGVLRGEIGVFNTHQYVLSVCFKSWRPAHSSLVENAACKNLHLLIRSPLITCPAGVPHATLPGGICRAEGFHGRAGFQRAPHIHLPVSALMLHDHEHAEGKS